MLDRIHFSKSNAAKLLNESLLDIGFAILSEPPIEEQLIQDTYKGWTDFFASESRFDFLFDEKIQAGYVSLSRSETAKGYAIKDLKEYYAYREGLICPRSTLEHTHVLYEQMIDLAMLLFSWIDEHMPQAAREQLPQSLLSMVQDSHEHVLRIIHYPPLTGQETPGALRAAPHEDINLITLLPVSTAPGLQVKDRKGKWHDVHCQSGDIVVNVAEMLELATNGYYYAGTHQVINPPDESSKKPRYSMPFFLHPKKEAYLKPGKSSWDFLQQRLQELGLI